MTTDQLSLLEGDLLSQRRFTLMALVADAVSVLTQPTTGLWQLSQADEAAALDHLRYAAAELRTLPGEEPVPF